MTIRAFEIVEQLGVGRTGKT